MRAGFGDARIHDRIAHDATTLQCRNLFKNSNRLIRLPEAAEQMEAYQQTTDDLVGEKLILNMGPSHPATHGVLRLILELDGEIITKADPDVGYLHRGDEKIAENMHYNQFVPYTDRLDYLAPLANNVAYACAVEKLMGWELPPRGQAIRVLCCELARISAHLLGVGVYAMDVGAMTVFLYTFTERENDLQPLRAAHRRPLHHLLHPRRRPDPRPAGGLPRRGPQVPRRVRDGSRRDRQAAHPQQDLLSTARATSAIISREDAIAYGLTGPNLRGSGVELDLRKAHPYLGYEKYDFDIPIGEHGDCYDRYLVRMEEMRQSVRILRQVLKTMPDGPINVVDPKSTLPDKERVLMSMEELIHHFIVATQGIDAPEGEVYFGAENPKGELGFYINSKGGGVPHRLKIRSPSFVNLSILPKLLPGHMVSRRRRHPRLPRLRHGRMRPLEVSNTDSRSERSPSPSTNSREAKGDRRAHHALPGDEAQRRAPAPAPACSTTSASSRPGGDRLDRGEARARADQGPRGRHLLSRASARRRRASTTSASAARCPARWAAATRLMEKLCELAGIDRSAVEPPRPDRGVARTASSASSSPNASPPAAPARSAWSNDDFHEDVDPGQAEDLLVRNTTD